MDQLGVLGHLFNLSSHFFVLHIDDGKFFSVVDQLPLLVLNSQNSIFFLVVEALNLAFQLIYSRFIFLCQKSSKHALLLIIRERLGNPRVHFHDLAFLI